MRREGNVHDGPPTIWFCVIGMFRTPSPGGATDISLVAYRLQNMGGELLSAFERGR
jgi:hypothetical protein